jgi:hypothetical protein
MEGMKFNQKTSRFATSPVVSPLAAAPSGEALPKRLKVLSWGDNPNAHGKTVRVGAKLLRALSAPAYPYAKVAIDFEHNTVPGSREYERTREPRAIAGYAEVECVEGEGVFLNVTRWTPDGLAHARDYEDLSAAPVTDADGDVVALPSVALCRAGAVPGIEFVECPLSAALPEQGQGDDMNYKELLAKLLGLGPDAEDEAIQAALDALDADKAKKDDEAKAAQEALSARVEALEKGREEDAKQRVILSARMEGKQVALSADALAKLSVEDVEKHVAALPVTVPLSAVTPSVVKEAAKPSAIDEGIMRNLGLTEEDFK